MSAKLNTLKVRRIDLLEQLEERYEWMTKEKEKYEAEYAVYKNASDKYFKDVEKWEARIPEVLEQLLQKRGEVNWGTNRYNGDASYRVTSSVDVDHKELEKIIGPYPVRPDNNLQTPNFLARRWSSKQGDLPNIYEAVYTTIKLLSLSDDETVPAATYQLALEAL